MQRRGLLFAAIGAVVATTAPLLAAAAPLDQVNTDGLITKIKKDVAQACEYYIFEPNDDETRAQLKQTIDVYLEEIRKRNDIYDYAVVAQSSPVDIQNNRLRMDVAIQRVKAREFIHLPITISQSAATLI